MSSFKSMEPSLVNTDISLLSVTVFHRFMNSLNSDDLGSSKVHLITFCLKISSIRLFSRYASLFRFSSNLDFSFYIPVTGSK